MRADDSTQTDERRDHYQNDQLPQQFCLNASGVWKSLPQDKNFPILLRRDRCYIWNTTDRLLNIVFLRCVTEFLTHTFPPAARLTCGPLALCAALGESKSSPPGQRASNFEPTPAVRQYE
jgi:hypothetical protein